MQVELELEDELDDDELVLDVELVLDDDELVDELEEDEVDEEEVEEVELLVLCAEVELVEVPLVVE